MTRRTFVALAIAWALCLGATSGAASPSPSGLVYLPASLADSPVFAADALQCSLLDRATGNGAGIAGQDGGWSHERDGSVYWMFSDTVLNAGSSFTANNIAVSAATPPATPASPASAPDTPCFSMTHRAQDGLAAPTLEDDASGCTSWPLQPVSTDTTADTGTLAFAFAPGPNCYDHGLGLGRLDLSTLESTRTIDVAWPPSGGGPAVTSATPLRADDGDGDFIYLFLVTEAPGAGCCWTTAIALARVAPESFDNPAAYDYWNGDGWVPWAQFAATDLRDNARFLWRQPSFGIQAGMQVTYLPHLHRWIAAYSTRIATQVRFRTAERLTGPWSNEQVLIDCGGPQLTALPPAPAGVGEFRCYSGQLHGWMTSDDGLTIYASFARQVFDLSDYRVYLHRFDLASPVWEWVQASGRRQLAAGSTSGEGTRAGLTFFASQQPLAGFTPVYEHTTDVDAIYSLSSQPPEGYRAGNVAFYAPTATAAPSPHHRIVPVRQLLLADGHHAYTIGVAPAGATDQGTAFDAIVPDQDDDADTTPDVSDPCPLDASTDQSDTDGDGAGDACDMDSDNDNVPNGRLDPSFVILPLDNCLLDYNPDQTNSDAMMGASASLPRDDATVPNGDFPGDACDEDDDNDGLADAIDNDARGDITYDDDRDGNPAAGCLGGTDADGSDDGPSWDDNCDGIRDGVTCLASAYVDSDHDGLADRWEQCKWGSSITMVDSDSDGLPDCREVLDVTGDGKLIFLQDSFAWAKGIMLRSFGKDGALDLNGDNRLTYLNDLLPAMKLMSHVAPGHC